MVQWSLRAAALLVWLGITSAFLTERPDVGVGVAARAEAKLPKAKPGEERAPSAEISLSAETIFRADSPDDSDTVFLETAIDRSSRAERMPKAEKPIVHQQTQQQRQPHRDICTSLCAGNVHSTTKELAEHCEKGCRFFDINLSAEQMSGKRKDLNSTKEKCRHSCRETCDDGFVQNCLIGCSEMHRFQKEALLFFVQQQGESGILEVEVSLVSDPALWEQTLNTNNGYKIPQTYMRTMPIRPDIAEVIDTKNWAPCAPPTNEIPRWIVGLIAIGLTIFTLYVSFILPSRSDILIEEGEYDRCRQNGSYFEDDLRKELGYFYHGEYISKKDGINDNLALSNLNLVTLNDFLVEDYHINVVPPPKYTLLPVDHKHSPV